MASGGQESDMVTVLLKTEKGVIRTKMNSQLAAIVLDPNGGPAPKKLNTQSGSSQVHTLDFNFTHDDHTRCFSGEYSSEYLSDCSLSALNEGSTQRIHTSSTISLNHSDFSEVLYKKLQEVENERTVHIWKEEEDKLLLELRLGEDNCFNSAKNHETLWNKITQEMNAQKVNVTKAQIINKWKTMKKKYKEVIDQNGKTGNSKTSWKYYDIFNNTYGNKAGTQASITYDSEGKQKLRINDKKEEQNKKEDCKKKGETL
ncbi:unnamed protein product [Mytilus coruscus]|uniref:Myb/SANT-like DNA-binding domain-containing protein n=1 Tax=Mytilus coruscus TaxID=42192 RepID=A0A6J7ZY06_MYTCO|nr:unnamed protein product [Mytilus coruscus]